MRGLYSHLREYRKIFLRDHFPHIGQILEGIHFGANTCRVCIRTRANTGKYSWRIIYVLVSCQGVWPPQKHTLKAETSWDIVRGMGGSRQFCFCVLFWGGGSQLFVVEQEDARTKIPENHRAILARSHEKQFCWLSSFSSIGC